jgi:hypothetical protein
MASPRDVPNGNPGVPSLSVPREPHQPLLAAILVLNAFYYSFRYPLQYNSAMTSLAYENTPTVLRAADDVALLLLLFAIVLLKIGHGRLLLNRRHITAAGAILVCFSGVLIGFGAKAIPTVKGVAIYSLLLAVTSAADLRYMVSFVFRHLLKFYVLLLLVNAIQITLYLVIHRPPALAWSTSRDQILTQNVRFGSLWDDPNSFGLFLAFVVTWVLYAKLPLGRKILLVAPALLAIAASWSRTSLVILLLSGGGFLLAEAWRARVKRQFLGGTIRVALTGCALTTAILFLPAAIRWTNESLSSKTHLRAVLMREVDAAPLRLSAGHIVHSESVFTFLGRNTGWLAAVALLVVLLVPTLHVFRFNRLSARDKTLAAWAVLSIFSFVAIPFLWLAPMGLLYFIVYGYLLDLFGRASVES